jgi:hypothetical protein
VRHVYNEVLRRFPEARPFIGEHNSELPYLVVGAVVERLRTVAKPSFDPNVVQRVVEFDRWCVEQPPGASAEDDLLTIEVVALREKLFKYDELMPLIPHLMSREELLENREYLATWVGADRLQAALRLTPKKK